ncbi:ESAT-6 protein secretion system EspG family protein [Halopolyspora algeriensis]|uniref:ESAT-6 protein secretion system EspG family protein n=1 Tax=Halopolyspora algeriensis TaxID=1500506 RepID=A0A368VIE4_9ACTN|nr:ESX secretion-associated protein EspG [Halopolyspora algeriensis]RCW39969.1 ESAT-6 protein secretion system EspG family protein [Halopolyspora algeriensis]TQM46594.1 ESAT-6 protein secretion system EspG family protein [Halopolyspora algeriensis]
MGDRVERIIERPIVMSYTCYDVLHHGECGESAPKPAGLEGLSPGRTNRERIRIITEVLADLRERGLAVVDTPVRPLREAIRLLHNSHRRLYGRYAIREGDGVTQGGFHIAESEGCAVLAAWEGEQLVLEPLSPETMLPTVVSLLPATAPIDDAAMVVAPERPPRHVPDGPAELRAQPAREEGRPDPAQDAVQRNHDRLEELTTGPLDFVMQIGRSTRTAGGSERACEHPLNYYAGARGALLTVLKRPGEGSALRRHVLPATRENVLRELRELGRAG